MAQERDTATVVQHFSVLASDLGVVLPVSHFERAGLARYNALAIVDADGTVKANYRKTHIPQAPGYDEKFYFNPGDSGFQVVETRFGRLGCGIFWDLWFSETVRCLALQGAEVLMFPTAIGSEPLNPALDSSGLLRRTMQGHAAANMIPLVASNRIGSEVQGHTACQFYGGSLITGYTGEILVEADAATTCVITACVNLDETALVREGWGVFRDRRPECYQALQTLDGHTFQS